jgi:insulysin
VSPLLTESAKDKEMHAVDSEHAKNLLRDEWRLFQLQKHVSDPSGPFAKFSTGDLTTLDKPGVHAALLRFHDAYYTADRMRLTVLGRQPLSVLRDYVNACVGSARPVRRASCERCGPG